MRRSNSGHPPPTHMVSSTSLCVRSATNVDPLQAQKVLQISEGEGRNTHKIDYDERNPFCA